MEPFKAIQPDPLGFSFASYSAPHSFIINNAPDGYDITVFGALPKVDFEAVKKLNQKARDEIANSDSAVMDLTNNVDLLIERCEKLQNILNMLIAGTVKN